MVNEILEYVSYIGMGIYWTVIGYMAVENFRVGRKVASDLEKTVNKEVLNYL